MSEADEIEDITNAAGTGAVDFPNGLNIAGSNSGIVGAKHTVSTTEPSTPSNGDTWYNTNGNYYYVRINNEWKAWLGSPPSTLYWAGIEVYVHLVMTGLELLILITPLLLITLI